MTKHRGRGGFGSTEKRHEGRFDDLLVRVEGHLASAERVLRSGDCHSAVDSFSAAFEEYGEARAHRDALPSTSLDKQIRQKRWIRAGIRLNFLRQSLKQCVGG